MILDHKNLIGEVKKISEINISTSTILLDRPLVNEYDINNTIVYPTFFSTLAKVSLDENESDSVSSVALKFDEYVKGVE